MGIKAEGKSSNNNRLIESVIFICVLSLGVVLSFSNFLLFHTATEFFSISIAFAAYMILLINPRESDSNYTTFLGYSYFFVAIIDLLHTITYKGMNVIPNLTSNTPTQLWVAARYLQSISLLAANYFHNRRINKLSVNVVYSVSVIGIIASIFVFPIFPVCYIEGQGLTLFKILSEYIISLILIISLGILVRNRDQYSPRFIRGIGSAIVLMIFSEIAFTFYVSVYGISNLIGHVFKVLASYIIYNDVIRVAVKDPFNTLYRSLAQSEAQFRGFMHAATDAFILLDKDLKYLEVNDSWLHQSGLNREDVIGKHMLDLFPELKESGRYDAYKKVISTGVPITYHTVDSMSHQGTKFDLSAFITGENLGIISRDVSERVRSEESVRVSEERLRSFMDSASDNFYLYNKNLILIDINDAGLFIFPGLSKTDVLGKHMTELIPQIEETDRYQRYLSVLETGKPISFDQVLHPSIADLHISIHSFKVGEGLGISTRDVSERVRYQGRLETLHGHAAALALAETREEIADITQNSLNDVIGFYVGGIAFIEGEFLVLHGHWGMEWSGSYNIPLNRRGITNHAVNSGTTQNVGNVHENPFYNDTFGDQKTGSELAVPIIVSKKVVGVINIESEIQDAFIENDQRLVETLASHIAAAYSKIIYLERLNALHDFNLELGLKDSKEEIVETAFRIMSEIFDSQFASVQLLDKDELITVGSSNALYLGMTIPISGKGVATKAAREACTILLGDVRTDPDFFTITFETLSELAVPILVEDIVLGVLNVESLNLDAYTEDDAKLMEILAQNVGAALFRIQGAEEKSELEHQLLVQQVQVEQEQELSRLKTQFMNTATHEIRTPITSIKGYTELISDTLNIGDVSTAKKYFKVVSRNVDRLEHLSDDLLDMQRLEPGRIKLDLQPYSVDELLTELESEIKPVLEQRDQVLNIFGDTNMEFYFDKPRISQVLVNLVHNASKFSPEDSEIIINTRKNDGQLSFSVTDNGIGISKEDIEKLFVPFPDIHVKDARHGSGLGLSICRGIVELHGGEIWVESDGPGKGSTVRFTIPVKE